MGRILDNRKLCIHRMLSQKDVEGVFCNITWDNLMCWDLTPAGTIAKQNCPDYVNGLNNAAFATRECLENGTWKSNNEYNTTDGWTNYSSCIGGVEAPKDFAKHLARIQLMSEIGYGISLAALIIAVLIMILSKRLHCKSNSLHINLFLAFILRASVSFLKNTIFVEGVGLEKDIIRGPGGSVTFKKGESHWECKLVVTVFLYTVAASLMWIFMEGLYLHMLVYKTLFTERHGVRLYLFLGWISPLLYIIPWIVVRVRLDDELCWNTYEEDLYVWIIKGPIVFTVLVNFVFFIDIVRVLCKRVRSHRYPKGSSKHLRKNNIFQDLDTIQFSSEMLIKEKKIAKFALVLIPLFGVIYIGFAAYPHGLSVEADLTYLYCEMFYNSIQGFILALLFCFLNEEVHNEIRRHWYRQRFTRFHTRSVFMSSWRKTSNVSRGTVITARHFNDTRRSNSDEDAEVHSNISKKRRFVPINWKRSTINKGESLPLNSNNCNRNTKSENNSLTFNTEGTEI